MSEVIEKELFKTITFESILEWFYEDIERDEYGEKVDGEMEWDEVVALYNSGQIDIEFLTDVFLESENKTIAEYREMLIIKRRANAGLHTQYNKHGIMDCNEDDYEFMKQTITEELKRILE